MLTVQYEAHENHQLVDDPFTFPAHLKSSEEFQEALRQAVSHRSHLKSVPSSLTHTMPL
jgi:hypothetical protein